AITPAEFLDRFQERCGKLETIKAEFIQKTQVITVGPLKNKEKKGIMYLKRPSKMRWNYIIPEDYHIISDGNKIWFYDKKKKQVMVGKLNTFFDKHLLVSLFLDVKNVTKLFRVSLKEEENLIKLVLSPYPSRLGLRGVTVWITRKDYQITKIQLVDFYGNINTLTFTKIIYNPVLKDTLFSLQTPPGVELIRLP
ncbi:MAG: outer membrane lipoprotein carrier protein LolA, partial [Candidatus Desulfofervidaceae bacterium]|nr:outer membrane lipoprotein carrier protein LolA [Candidatus Desulfofervidaceae bacterium]